MVFPFLFNIVHALHAQKLSQSSKNNINIIGKKSTHVDDFGSNLIKSFFTLKCDFLIDLDPFVLVMLKKENQLLLGPLLMLLNSPENKLDKRKKGDHWGVLKHTAALGATKEKW